MNEIVIPEAIYRSLVVASDLPTFLLELRRYGKRLVIVLTTVNEAVRQTQRSTYFITGEQQRRVRLVIWNTDYIPSYFPYKQQRGEDE